VDWHSSQTHSLLMYSGVFVGWLNFVFGLASSGFSFVVVGCGIAGFSLEGRNTVALDSCDYSQLQFIFPFSSFWLLFGSQMQCD
jgi:hypothetical protein